MTHRMNRTKLTALPETHAFLVGRLTEAFARDYRDGQKVLRLLRDARLYDIPAATATGLYREVQRHVYENLLGVDFSQATSPRCGR